MTIDKLREVHQTVPFRAFRLYLAAGGQIPVTHPESLAYSRSGRTVVVVSPDDKTQFVDVLLVTRIEIVDGAQSR